MGCQHKLVTLEMLKEKVKDCGNLLFQYLALKSALCSKHVSDSQNCNITINNKSMETLGCKDINVFKMRNTCSLWVENYWEQKFVNIKFLWKRVAVKF